MGPGAQNKKPTPGTLSIAENKFGSIKHEIWTSCIGIAENASESAKHEN
jgi:hypothetical protein